MPTEPTKLKSAEEWDKEGKLGSCANLEVIRQIQHNALLFAAELIEMKEELPIDCYTCRASMCDSILTEANKLLPQQTKG